MSRHALPVCVAVAGAAALVVAGIGAGAWATVPAHVRASGAEHSAAAARSGHSATASPAEGGVDASDSGVTTITSDRGEASGSTSGAHPSPTSTAAPETGSDPGSDSWSAPTTSGTGSTGGSSSTSGSAASGSSDSGTSSGSTKSGSSKSGSSKSGSSKSGSSKSGSSKPGSSTSVASKPTTAPTTPAPVRALTTAPAPAAGSRTTAPAPAPTPTHSAAPVCPSGTVDYRLGAAVIRPNLAGATGKQVGWDVYVPVTFTDSTSLPVWLSGASVRIVSSTGRVLKDVDVQFQPTQLDPHGSIRATASDFVALRDSAAPPTAVFSPTQTPNYVRGAPKGCPATAAQTFG